MSQQEQKALDSLYALDNVLTINISMPKSDWEAVRTEQPKGGRCNFDWTDGARYTWRKATSVEIVGTKFPARTTFTEVGIKKKSFCGSISSEKPCLHIDFGKFRKANTAVAAQLMGSRYLTMNNSIQDPSYIRQPLGYKLFEMAGLPYSRCNFARVFVNGTPIGQGFAGVNSPGVFVNAEPIMPRYIERNFNGNTKGNLYELEHNDDFVSGRFKFIGVESLSEFDDKADLRFAIDHIDEHGLAGASEVFDLDQFIRLNAMEFFLKHWDGYSRNTNNTYVYNDTTAVAAPGVDNVNFKMIPWGLDQTLQATRHFKLDTTGLIAKLVRNDSARRAHLLDQISTYRETVFGRAAQETVLTPMILKMEALLTGLGVPNVPAELGSVRKQLRLAGSAGYLCAGLPDADGAYIRDDTTNDCLHASNTEGIPKDVPDPVNFEVVHRPRPTVVDDSDLWCFDDLGAGKSVTSKAFSRFLHASSIVSSQGNKLLYTGPANNSESAEEFSVVPLDSPDKFTFSGYFNLVSKRTGLSTRFGTDTTPSGKPRVHQETGDFKLFFT
ncbi:UNVERIFIED_CONTAM: CotH protein [Williamsia faeni]